MKPNIFLLIIDSFNAEKCRGPSKTSITPNIDKLISDGIYFEQTISAAPQSSPSISSLFTSQYPFKSIISKGDRYNINQKIPNLVSILKENGYTSYATVPKTISLYDLTFNFDHEEVYEDAYSQTSKHRESIIENLQSMNSPWFYYVHLLDIHTINNKDNKTQRIPEEFDSPEFGSNPYDRMLSALDLWIGKFLQSIDHSNTLVLLSADHGSDVSKYSKEQAQNRSEIKNSNSSNIEKLGSSIIKKSPLFNPFKKKLKQKFLEQKENQKKNKQDEMREKISNMNISPSEKRFRLNAIKTKAETYDDRFCIPLIFHGLNLPKSTLISKQVRSVDIFPTIMELLEINYNSDQIVGKSLIPLIHGKSYDEQPAFLTSATNWTKSLSSDTVGIRTSSFKYFRDRLNIEKNIHLYDLDSDPNEDFNIASENKSKVLEMESILQNILGNETFEYSSSDDDIDDSEVEEIQEHLKKLGYI